VYSGRVRIENEDGAWSGVVDGYHAGTYSRESIRLVGEGAYEGLTAVLRWVGAPEVGADHVVDGVIVPGVPPDYPAPIVPESMTTDLGSSGDGPASKMWLGHLVVQCVR